MWRPERLRRGLGLGLLAAALSLGSAARAEAPQSVPQSVPLSQASVAQIEHAAAAALAAGQRADALALARALLARDPENPLGHYVIARLMLGAGQTETARAEARLSFSRAQSPRQRYEAARVAAQVAVAEKRWAAAQYWARQTIQFAPDARARAVGVSDFRRLRVASPLSFSVKLGIRPSNNVNGGADERTNVIDGFDAVGWLSDDAMALRGVAGTADVDAGWRIAQDAKSETRLGLSGYARVVELSGTPMMVPPYAPGTPAPAAVEIPNSEYSSASLAVNLRHSRVLAPGLNGAATVEAGRSWQGGTPGYDWGALRLDGSKALGRATRLSFGAGYEHRDWVDSPRQDDRRSLNLGLGLSGKAGDWGLGVSAASLGSTSAQARSWSVSGSVRYAPKAQIGPVSLSLSAGVSTTVYPDYTMLGFHPAGGRQDDMVYAELGLWAPKMGLAAFTPEVKLQALQVHSNVSRFSRSEISVAVGWRSAF